MGLIFYYYLHSVGMTHVVVSLVGFNVHAGRILQICAEGKKNRKSNNLSCCCITCRHRRRRRRRLHHGPTSLSESVEKPVNLFLILRNKLHSFGTT